MTSSGDRMADRKTSISLRAKRVRISTRAMPVVVTSFLDRLVYCAESMTKRRLRRLENASSMGMNSNGITKKQEKFWLVLMKMGRGFGCHQIAERSFFYRGFQFPICARCTGILIGELFIAPISLLLFPGNYILSVFCLLVMAVDGLLQYYGKIPSTNLRRLITGLMGGYGAVMIAIFIIS